VFSGNKFVFVVGESIGISSDSRLFAFRFWLAEIRSSTLCKIGSIDRSLELEE
jgi:hypothetical protein